MGHPFHFHIEIVIWTIRFRFTSTLSSMNDPVSSDHPLIRSVNEIAGGPP